MSAKTPRLPTLDEIARKHGWTYSKTRRDSRTEYDFVKDDLRATLCLMGYGTVTIWYGDLSVRWCTYIDQAYDKIVHLHDKEAFVDALLPLLTRKEVLSHAEAQLRTLVAGAQHRAAQAQSNLLHAERQLQEFLLATSHSLT
jgi:hypothetical protein